MANDHVITPAPARAIARTKDPTVVIMLSAEHWQFFAFVFAALITLIFAVVDVVVGQPWFRPVWLLPIKLLFFVVLGYLTLRCRPVQRWLLRVLLTAIKEERHVPPR